MFQKLKNPIAWIVLLIILGTALLGASAYFGYSYYKSKQKTEDKKTEEKTTDPYEGWRTYVNTDVGYKLRYPADWTIKETNGTSEVMLEEQVKYITMTSAKKNTLHFGIAKDGASFNIADRTGVGAGEDQAVPGMETTLLGATVAPYAHVWGGKTKEYFYKFPTKPAEYSASIWFDPPEQDYDTTNMPTEEIPTVNKIFTSVEWLKESNDKSITDMKDVVSKVMDARIKRSLTDAKPYMTDACYASTNAEGFAGTSSPSMGKYAITSYSYLTLDGPFNVNVKTYWYLQNQESGTAIWEFSVVKQDGKFLVNELKMPETF